MQRQGNTRKQHAESRFFKAGDMLYSFLKGERISKKRPGDYTIFYPSKIGRNGVNANYRTQ